MDFVENYLCQSCDVQSAYWNLLLEPYAAGTRDSEKYIFPDLTKVSVTINDSTRSTTKASKAKSFGKRPAVSF